MITLQLDRVDVMNLLAVLNSQIVTLQNAQMGVAGYSEIIEKINARIEETAKLQQHIRMQINDKNTTTLPTDRD